MRTPGIATKLFLAFGGLFALALVAALVGWQGFQRIADTQDDVIDQAIPGLRHAHRLAEVNTLIGSASQRLVRVAEESARQQISQVLFGHVRVLRDLLDDFELQGFAERHLQSLRQTVADIAANLRQQNDLVQQRLQQRKRIDQLASRLIAATVELNELADSLVANAAATTTAITSSLYDMVEDDAGDQQLYDVFDRLVEVDIDGLERMYELRLRSANLGALINQVIREDDATRLDGLRRQSVETLSILRRRVDEINDPLRQRRARELLAAMELASGPLYVKGIFESKLALLRVDDELRRLRLDYDLSSQRLDAIVGDLTRAGGSLITEASVAARESLDSSRALFNWSAIVSLLVAALVLWLYIKRNVIRRLLALETATLSIARGQYEVAIDSGGSDELSKMAGALRVFRDNAIDKRRVDDELQEYKTHLEQLVGQRTAELEQANTRLAEVAQQHAAARDKAEQADRAKTAFLATMSHELRTPLSGALGTLRLLEDTDLCNRQREYVRIIGAANASLLEILNDILGYSRIETGKLEIENRRFSLTSLLHDIVALMSVPAREKGNRIDAQFAAGLPRYLYGDSGKLHQILLNLIGNAVKFTDNGVITVRASADAQPAAGVWQLRFVVRDTGVGIARDKQQDIFRAFTQGDASIARRHGGIGLGLAICDRLVTALGGKISLESSPGEGTTIGFQLEMSVSDATDQALDHVTRATTADSIHALVVEDDPTNRMIAHRYLEKLGHTVSAAEHGEAALEVLDEQSIDLVLLDVGLPGMDGLEILGRIRTHEVAAVRQLPVIAMSAHVFQEEVDQYMRAGMDGFLGKPFSLGQLSESIQRLAGGVPPVVVDQRMSNSLLDTTLVDDDIRQLGADNVREMVELFGESGEQLMQRFLQHAARGENSQAADLAHKLRGAAGNFGLHRLCALVADLEQCAKRGELASDAGPARTQLHEVFTRSLGELRQHLQRQGVAVSNPARVSRQFR